MTAIKYSAYSKKLWCPIQESIWCIMSSSCITRLFAEKSGSDPYLWCTGTTRHPILSHTPDHWVRDISFMVSSWIWLLISHMVLLLSEHWFILCTVEFWHIILGCKLQFILVLMNHFRMQVILYPCVNEPSDIQLNAIFFSQANMYISSMWPTE